MTNPAKIEVGKEYAVGQMFSDGTFVPLHCNSRFSPNHPCRITVLSIGRKNVKALFSGSDKPQTMPIVNLYELEFAKPKYRLGLERREKTWQDRGVEGMGQEFVDRCVEQL